MKISVNITYDVYALYVGNNNNVEKSVIGMILELTR